MFVHVEMELREGKKREESLSKQGIGNRISAAILKIN